MMIRGGAAGLRGAGLGQFAVPSGFKRISAASIDALAVAANEAEDAIARMSAATSAERSGWLEILRDGVITPLVKAWPELRGPSSPVSITRPNLADFFGFGRLSNVGGTAGVVMVEMRTLRDIAETYEALRPELIKRGETLRPLRLVEDEERVVVTRSPEPVATVTFGPVTVTRPTSVKATTVGAAAIEKEKAAAAAAAAKKRSNTVGWIVGTLTIAGLVIGGLVVAGGRRRRRNPFRVRR